MRPRTLQIYLFLIFSFNVKAQIVDSLVVSICKSCSESPEKVAGDCTFSYSREIFAYDSLDQLVYTATSTRPNLNVPFAPDDSTLYTYDSLHRNINIIHTVQHNSLNNTPYRVFFTYDSLNNVISYLKEVWSNQSSSWNLTEEIFNQYNILGEKDSVYTFGTTQTSAITTRKDSSLNLKTVIQWLWNGSVWSPNIQERWWSNSQSLDSLYLKEIWDGTGWQNVSKTEWTYNISNLIIEIRSSLWQISSWQNQSKLIYDYNASNQEILYENYRWVDSTQQWLPLNKQVNLYSTAPSAVTNYFFSWNLLISVWDSTAITTEYSDSLGRPIRVVNYDFSTGHTSETNSHYDNFGNLTESYHHAYGYWSSFQEFYDANNYLIHSERIITSVYAFSSENYCDWYRFPADSLFISLPDTLHICPGETKELTGEVIYPEGNYSFQWSPGSGVSNDTILLPEFSVQTTSSYTLTVSDTSGVVRVFPLVVNIETPPQPAIIDSVLLSGHCFPDTILLVVNTQPEMEYRWYTPGSPNIVAFNDTLYYSKNGQTTILFVESINIYGCKSNSDTIQVSMLPAPITYIYPNLYNYCSGDTLQLSVYSQAGRTYQWRVNGIDSVGATSDTLSVTQNGDYSIYVLDQNNLCDYTHSYNATFSTVSPLPLITAFPDTVICRLDTSWLRSVNTNAGWQYEWFAGGNPISANGSIIPVTYGAAYYLKISSANCAAYSDTITFITDYFFPYIVSSPGSLSICSNDSVILQGSPAQQYLWSTGETTDHIIVDTAGVYSFLGTDSLGCQIAANEIVISVYPISAAPQISFNSPYLESSISTGSLQWYLNDTLIQGASTSSHQPSVDGSYTVALTDSNGCSVFSNPYYYSILKLNSIENEDAIKLYPNPVTDKTVLAYKGIGNMELVEIYDSKFVKISSVKNPGVNYFIGKSEMSRGLYFCRVTIDVLTGKEYRWIKFAVQE